MKINKQLVTYASVGVFAVAAIATSAAIGPIWAPQAPAPAETSIVEPAEVVETPTPTPTVTPTPTPEPVVEAPAPPPPPPPAPPASSGAPAGTPLPFYPSTDPENAQGGSYADPGTFCASGSGSTVNGVPVCD